MLIIKRKAKIQTASGEFAFRLIFYRKKGEKMILKTENRNGLFSKSGHAAAGFYRNFAAALIFSLFLFLPSTAQTRDLSGRLAPTVEAGGWLIVAGDQKYLLLNADKFKGESWFREGAEVTATGEIRRDAVTIYQEGVPFEARTLRPAQGSTGDVQSGVSRITRVTVEGGGRVSAQPDTAIVSVSVVTQNRSAIEAQQQNASRTTAVIDALKRTAGADAEIKTSGYVLIPQRVYKENQPPTITGYEARNSITVTLSDLNRTGAVIDAAASAGANNIDGVSFTLRRDTQARGEALQQATQAALAKAKALAQTFGGRILRIVAVEEGGATPRPLTYAAPEAIAARTADTPIETGSLEINAQVRLIAEIETSENPR